MVTGCLHVMLLASGSYAHASPTDRPAIHALAFALLTPLRQHPPRRQTPWRRGRSPQSASRCGGCPARRPGRPVKGKEGRQGVSWSAVGRQARSFCLPAAGGGALHALQHSASAKSTKPGIRERRQSWHPSRHTLSAANTLLPVEVRLRPASRMHMKGRGASSEASTL